MHVGVPFAPVSSAYSLVSTDYEKLRYVVGLLTPGLVFAADGGKFGRAIGAVVPAGTEVVLTRGAIPGRKTTPFAALEARAATDAVDQAHAAVGPDTIAKFLLTSGSTGNPKAVINTQRMLCSNMQMIAQTLPFVLDPAPVLVDWLPWNHTFGGNHNFSLVVYGGGTLYIDDGKPVPGLIEKTVRNLREIAPTVYFNVPRGFEELVPYLRREPALREKLFSRVGMLFYAGAGLSQPVWDAMDELAVQGCGERILWVTGLGATETAPSVTFTRGDGVRSGMIGLPVPGVEVKLAPDGDKTEMRVRGPSVTPGYWRQPELTRAAFDDEGFYRLGDAVAWVDAADPRKGLVFDGRVAEDFKLATGTWVSVGPLRAKLIAAGAPFVQDVVITGLNRDWIGALVFPRLDECRALAAGLAARRAGVGGPRASGGAREVPVALRRVRARGDRQLDADRARDPARRAAVDRRLRDHRQGLDQPARGAEASRRAGRGAVRGDADAAHHRRRAGSTMSTPGRPKGESRAPVARG